MFESQEFEIKYAVQMTKGGSMNTDNRTRSCNYKIRKSVPSVCAIEFVFHEFMINDMGLDSNCDLDFFRITETEKLCSNLPNQMIKKIPFNEDIYNLQLHLSTSSMSQKRIYIKVKQIDCSPNENSITANPNAHHPNMNSPNLNQQQGITQMPSMHAPPIINQIPPQQIQQIPNIYSNNNQTDLVSKTSPNQFDYMNQFPPSICELCYTELSSEIISYNYPAAYPRNLNCNYVSLYSYLENLIHNFDNFKHLQKITGQPGFCGVYLRFDVFTINSAEAHGTTTTCTDDYVELNSVKYCGKQLENVKSKYG